jgi:hypothetical protein
MEVVYKKTNADVSLIFEVLTMVKMMMLVLWLPIECGSTFRRNILVQSSRYICVRVLRFNVSCERVHVSSLSVALYVSHSQPQVP